MRKNISFDYKQKISIGIVLILILSFALSVSITIAFFFNSVFGNSTIHMSGKVDIEAVGNGDLEDPDSFSSIEDTHTTKLVVTLADGYDVLIPGMDISVDANCKVYQSTTSPLLRAKLEFVLIDASTGLEVDGSDFENGEIGSSNYLVSDICGKLIDIIEENDWYLHTDSYYYYLGEVIQPVGATGGNQFLKEVNVTAGDVVVPFLNKPFKFPTEIDSTYSGFGVKIKITFQAIQNFIAEKDSGIQLDNTITNSQIIFNDISSSYFETTSLDYFNITTNAKGQLELNLDTSKQMPEVVVLPSFDANGNEITAIGTTFQNDTGVKKVVIPESYTTMATHAFSNSSAISVDMSESKITEIPDYCFYNAKLVDVKLPEGLLSIGDYAFYATNLNSITFPNSLTTIGSKVFFSVNFQSLYIPENVSSIGLNFIGDQTPQLSQLIVSEDNQYYKDIDDIMLLSKDGTLLKEVVTVLDSSSFSVPDGIETIENGAMHSTSITSLYIPESVTTIGQSVFPSTLTSLVVDENNISFSSDEYAFYNESKTTLILCLVKNIDTFNVPVSVEYLQDESFNNCIINNLNFGANLRSFTTPFLSLQATNINIDDGNTYLKDDNGKAILSKDGKTLYKYATNNSATSYTTPSTVTLINPQAFMGATNLQTVTLNSGITEIQYGAFRGCSNMTSINIPSTINDIESNVFWESGITQISIYGTLGVSCFFNCANLKDVVINTSCTSVGERNFQNCTALESVEFKSTTPPTFASSNLFSNTNDTFKIYVPDSAVDTYKAVTQLAPYVDRILPVSQK